MIELIKSRRSCRNYTTQKVTQQELDTIVECGLLAPSGRNWQVAKFYVINDLKTLEYLADIKGSEFYFGASVLIIVYGEKEDRYLIEDGSCAITQMSLAAHALGLGTCWINQLTEKEDNTVFKDFLDMIGLSDKYIVGSLAIGHTEKEMTVKNIKSNRVRYHYND